ncbi:putative reverse transcriptase zinc-binding domain-containing protein [Helianthus annuus]|nr:putative reverse transcriptase zinc-binding domain-containing protein [Helianthus annuus]
MKRVKFWQPVVERFNKKLSKWKAKNLSFAGRVTLAKAVLGSLPSYYLSLFAAPKAIISKLEKIRRDFLWGKAGSGHKLRWVRWELVTRPKKMGGIGLGGIKEFNLAMLSKWWWRIREEPRQLWAEVISAIHKTKNNNLLIPLKKTIVGTWKDISSMEVEFLKYGVNIQEKLKVKVGNGNKTRFWKDVWLEQQPLKDVYPELYRMAKDKDCTIASCLVGFRSNNQWGWEWIKAPSTTGEWEHLGNLMDRLTAHELNGSRDEWTWSNSFGEKFSVKSIRMELMAGRPSSQQVTCSFVWNVWAPPKCNMLVWRALMGKIASKKGLVDRGVALPDTVCPRCGISEEDANHIFANCLWTRSLWWNIFVWMKLKPPDSFNSLKDIIEDLMKCPGSKTWRRLVYTIATATTWRIWIARNSKIFDDAFIPIQKTMEMIKEDVFFWVCNRASIPSPRWENWVNFDVADIV